MDTSITLLTSKTAFLTHQARLLSQPLTPSAEWSTFAPPTTLPPLPPSQIATALSHLNDKLKRHAKTVYSAPSQRHVAEQIDALYWGQVLKEEGEMGGDSLAVRTEVDFRDREIVEGLPEELEELTMNDDQVVSGEDAERYALLRRKLGAAIRRRDEQRGRLEGYRVLREVIGGLEAARENVQPNLMTRDGELGRELERMRVLCARVAARVGGVVSQREGLGEGMGDRERLRGVMDLK